MLLFVTGSPCGGASRVSQDILYRTMAETTSSYWILCKQNKDTSKIFKAKNISSSVSS